MNRIQQGNFGGLMFDGARPLHPLLVSYFSMKGYKIYIEDGHVVIDGDLSLPNKKIIFLELIELSKQLHGDVVFDLIPHENSSGTRSFEVVDKQANKAPAVTRIELKKVDQEISDLLFIEYLLGQDAVVYLGNNNEICYLAGNEPLDNNMLIDDAKKFISEAISRMKIQQNNPSNIVGKESLEYFYIDNITPEFDDLLMNKYFLSGKCQIAINQEGINYTGGNIPDDMEKLHADIDNFKITEFAKLSNNGLRLSQPPELTPAEEEPQSPGLFTTLSNWFWGLTGEKKDTTDTNAPRPRP